MTDITATIADVLAAHGFTYDYDNVRHTCLCHGWVDSGPSEARLWHNFNAHLAEVVAAALATRWVWRENPYIEQEFNGDVVISDRLALALAAAALIAAARVAEGVRDEQ